MFLLPDKNRRQTRLVVAAPALHSVHRSDYCYHSYKWRSAEFREGCRLHHRSASTAIHFLANPWIWRFEIPGNCGACAGGLIDTGANNRKKDLAERRLAAAVLLS